MQQKESGILIIAQGADRYISMARNIAMSLAISNPGIPRALVTDSSDPDLKAYYDEIIPLNEAYGKGFSQKLHACRYSPFCKTMLIDVDCLVIRDIQWLFKRFQGHAVSVIGRKVFSGPLIGTTVEALQQKINVPYLLSFNGGVYYFEKGSRSDQVFEKALDLFQNRYEELGLSRFNGRPGDEPVMSIAMGLSGMEPVSDDLKGMYTPVGQHGVFKMDALKGYCEFYKYHDKVSPAIMHFGAGYPEAFHYRREQRKILLVYRFGWPRAFTSFVVNLVYNPAYTAYVFLYRLMKFILKGKKFKISPAMPMFRFE